MISLIAYGHLVSVNKVLQVFNVIVVGSSVGADDLQPFTTVDGTTQFAENSAIMPTGLVFVTVTCVNQALLYTTVTSDGVLVFSSPPDHANATLTILSLAQTVYPIMENFVPSPSLILSWTGFEDLESSHLYYEYRITESSGATQGWIDAGATLQLLISNFNITQDQKHTVEIRARNPAGLISQPIAENFTISAQVPVDTGVYVCVVCVFVVCGCVMHCYIEIKIRNWQANS